MYSLKNHKVRFQNSETSWSHLEIVRSNGTVVKSEDLRNSPVEIILDESGDGTIDLKTIDRIDGDDLIEVSVPLSENPYFEVNTVNYGGIGTSDLRDISRKANVFHIDRGRLSFYLNSKEQTMEMTGKPYVELDKHFFYEVIREKALGFEASFLTTSPIRNIQQMWDAAIKYRKAGEFDSDAMRLIYRRMDPRLTAEDIASVFSGVYSGSYWATIFMDPELLAASLRKGLGLEMSLARSYAKRAMGIWRGILCRNNFNDVGQIPATGGFTRSPDIACNQNTPLDPFQLINDWNNEFWRTPQVGKNFVYVRCQNSQFMGDISPSVRMFFTKAGFNQPPTSWNTILTESGELIGKIVDGEGKPATLGLGRRGVSEAFIYDTTTSGHVCLIAAISDEFFDNNDPTRITSNWDSARWITRNGASCWHNLDVQLAKEMELVFHNQDHSPQHFAFVVNCYNLPQGATVELNSRNPSLGIHTGPVTINSLFQTIHLETVLPAMAEGELEVTLLDANGNILPADSKVEIFFNWVLPQEHDQYAEALDLLGLSASVQAGQNLQVPLGSYTLIGAEN